MILFASFLDIYMCAHASLVAFLGPLKWLITSIFSAINSVVKLNLLFSTYCDKLFYCIVRTLTN